MLPHLLGTAVLLLLSAAVLLAATPKIPVAEFARDPEFSRIRLSPDGESVAFLREHNGRTLLHVGDLATMRASPFDPGYAPAFGTTVPKEVVSFQWVANDRLTMTTSVWGFSYGLIAVDRDGKNWVPISGYEADPTGKMVLWASEIIYRFEDEDRSVLMLDRNQGGGRQRFFPNVIRTKTRSGGSSVVVKNPGNVVGWEPDYNGIIRLGVTVDDKDRFGVIFRETEDSPWRELLPPDAARGQLLPLGFTPGGSQLVVSGLTPNQKRTVYLLDLETGRMGDPLLDDDVYDIMPERGAPSYDGLSLARVIESESRQAVIGLRYYTDAPRVRWFDRQFAAFQVALDKALPNTVNIPVSIARDDKRVLVLAFSDRHPGEYFVHDFEKRSLRGLGRRMPGINPEHMAEMRACKYTARDGLEIHGYITLPVGAEPRNLPLVVMPHGGPWVRDTWGFDPFVQFLANRGYAVLQMNYRGSTGYGADFSEKGRREIGRAIQNDIEDGARWAIAAGVADPHRVAIVGGSYGGFSALFALGNNPDLYRCGISIAGVTDWLAIFRQGRSDTEYEFAYRYWVAEVGDPSEEEGEEFLASISPVNFANRITAPVLIVQGREDRTVPAKQARDMIAALEKAGRRPESLFLAGEGHSFTSEKARIQLFERVEAFLAKHMAPTRTR